MDWLNILNQIFEICIIPLLGVLTVCLVIYIKVKKNELIDKYNNETLTKYLNMLETTITTCVIATNQTYVETLKKQGAFDAEAQKVAFDKTYNAVMTILTDDAKKYLQTAIGDLKTYIVAQIEANVNMSK